MGQSLVAAPAFDRDALPAPVLAFATKEQLLPHLEHAASLADSLLRPSRQLIFELETDPESDEQRLIVDAPLDCGVDEALVRNGAFTRAWVSATPPGVRDKIRVLYHLA